MVMTGRLDGIVWNASSFLEVRWNIGLERNFGEVDLLLALRVVRMV